MELSCEKKENKTEKQRRNKLTQTVNEDKKILL